MMSRDFRSRMDMNKIQTNVIMTQIRAQKHRKCIKIVDPILTPSKIKQGRKHFQQNLCQITDITNTITINNQQDRSVSKGRGKRTFNRSYSQCNLSQEKSKSGRKHFNYDHLKQSAINPLVLAKKKINIKDIQISKGPAGKKRYDNTSTYQQRETPYSPLKWSNNIF